jgi:predicted transcriptional regulator of viral defense system
MLTYHASTGTFRRVYRGVYRFNDCPWSQREHVFAAWACRRKGDAAVVSYESALDIWDLSDLVPDAVYLALHRSLRSRAKRSLPGVVIHYGLA